jgi:hypothetical protein
MQFVLKHLLISQPFSRLIAKCLGSEWETGPVASNPSFSTREVCDPGSRSRTTSWSKGLPHKDDVLGLTQELSARTDAGWRLDRQGEVQLFEQEPVIRLRVGVAA